MSEAIDKKEIETLKIRVEFLEQSLAKVTSLLAKMTQSDQEAQAAIQEILDRMKGDLPDN